MMRVVRVLRFFKQLRMMMASIIASFATLFWSMVMLMLLMYIFGLMFLLPLSGYLHETPKHDIPDRTIESIEEYWSSVAQAMITLFMAITGGNDWAQLAEPLRTADPIFYFVFLFYITFSAVAMLNILTGMFVDSAMKVAGEEDSEVRNELEEQ